MKKLYRVALVMLLMTLICSTTQQAEAKKKFTVDKIKAYYVVMDAKTGEVLASNKANKKVYPASTTKVLTVITALDQLQQKGISIDSYVKVTKKMLKSVPSGSRCAYLHAKKWYSYRDIIGLVLVASAADAVRVLEKSLFGNEATMIQAMNTMAAKIGMTKSYFDNGIGLDNTGYKKIKTTAGDMVKLAQYATANYPVVNEITKIKKITVRDRSKKALHIFRNTNLFYRTAKYPKKQFKVVGMKTGYTRKAGVTLLTKAIAKKSKREVVVGVFHVKGNENVYTNTKLLLKKYCK